MVDKNLFLYDLALVTILKNGAQHYLKEWLDYHLAAGVDHFFLYDNSGNEDVREILKPYIEEQMIDCFAVTGENMQIPVYIDAVRKFKFTCRYMAFLDLNEFIFPKNGQSIVEVVDEALSQDERAAGLAINWQVFGSNGLEQADYSKGVLERFTRRAPSDWYELPTENTLPVGNIHVKTIANPRFIRSIINPHFAYYFNGRFAVNSAGGRVPYWGNEPPLTDKIVINCYLTKSKEEFQNSSDKTTDFEKNDRNDVEDEDILNYLYARAENYTPPKKFERENYFQTLEQILLPAVRSDVPDEFFTGKLEMFLTCRALSGVLRRTFPKDNRGKFLEEASLRVINRTHFTKMSFAEIMMMLNALPQILVLPYPAVADVHQNCMNFVRQILGDFHRNAHWDRFVEMGNYLELLSAFGATTRTERNAP